MKTKTPKYIIICNSKYKVLGRVSSKELLIQRVLICLPRWIPEIEEKQAIWKLIHPIQNKFIKPIEIF